jgi:hypothetical protein
MKVLEVIAPQRSSFNKLAPDTRIQVVELQESVDDGIVIHRPRMTTVGRLKNESGSGFVDTYNALTGLTVKLSAITNTQQALWFIEQMAKIAYRNYPEVIPQIMQEAQSILSQFDFDVVVTEGSEPGDEQLSTITYFIKILE